MSIQVDLTRDGQISPPSFQSLFLKMKFRGTHLSSGTGFLVQTHTGVALVTARHNLTGRHHETDKCLHSKAGVPDTVEIFHNGFTPGINVIKSEPLFQNGGAPRWLDHPNLGDLCDVVLLPLHELEGVVLAPYTWSQNYADIAVNVAEPVSVVGFPMGQSAGGMLAIWCTGYVASEPSLDYAGQPKFLVDCRTRKGQSGSPVIASRTGAHAMQGGAFRIGAGYVMRPLGLYTGRIDPEADIGIVWKWSVVEDLMRQFDIDFSNRIRTCSTIAALAVRLNEL